MDPSIHARSSFASLARADDALVLSLPRRDKPPVGGMGRVPPSRFGASSRRRRGLSFPTIGCGPAGARRSGRERRRLSATYEDDDDVGVHAGLEPSLPLDLPDAVLALRARPILWRTVARCGAVSSVRS